MDKNKEGLAQLLLKQRYKQVHRKTFDKSSPDYLPVTEEEFKQAQFENELYMNFLVLDVDEHEPLQADSRKKILRIVVEGRNNGLVIPKVADDYIYNCLEKYCYSNEGEQADLNKAFGITQHSYKFWEYLVLRGATIRFIKSFNNGLSKGKEDFNSDKYIKQKYNELDLTKLHFTRLNDLVDYDVDRKIEDYFDVCLDKLPIEKFGLISGYISGYRKSPKKLVTAQLIKLISAIIHLGDGAADNRIKEYSLEELI